MSPEIVEAHRAAAEVEAARILKEREAAAQVAEEEFRTRLHRARILEAQTGAPSVPSVGEILAREDARSDRAVSRQEREAAIAAGTLTNLDAASPPARRPAELQQVADARAARESRELAEDLTASGHPLAGAMQGQLGKRP